MTTNHAVRASVEDEDGADIVRLVLVVPFRHTPGCGRMDAIVNDHARFRYVPLLVRLR